MHVIRHYQFYMNKDSRNKKPKKITNNAFLIIISAIIASSFSPPKQELAYFFNVS